eukprot:scaffold24105_cov113-Isochrysis_galbana.AAC.12
MPPNLKLAALNKSNCSRDRRHCATSVAERVAVAAGSVTGFGALRSLPHEAPALVADKPPLAPPPRPPEAEAPKPVPTARTGEGTLPNAAPPLRTGDGRPHPKDAAPAAPPPPHPACGAPSTEPPAGCAGGRAPANKPNAPPPPPVNPPPPPNAPPPPPPPPTNPPPPPPPTNPPPPPNAPPPPITGGAGVLNWSPNLFMATALVSPTGAP